MALHPGVQARAQDELDSVIGRDRLPAISDRGSLPYVEAVIQEVMRWHPMLPLSEYPTILCVSRLFLTRVVLGIARRAAQDDVYEGWVIPKGTIVMPNSWYISFLLGLSLLVDDVKANCV